MVRCDWALNHSVSVEIALYGLIGIGVLLLIFIHFGLERGLETLIEWLFKKSGLQSGDSPLRASARWKEDQLELTLENLGKEKFKLAAIEGRDRNGGRHFPIPCLIGVGSSAPCDEATSRKQFSKITLVSGEPITVDLGAAEVQAMDCRSLNVLGDRGRAWPVEGFLVRGSSL